MTIEPVRPQTNDSRWAGVAEMRYKAEGTAPFRDITRQVLFQDPALACELRYFEMQPGGYSTLERHEHTHAVMIQRGARAGAGWRPRARRARARPCAHPSADVAPVPRARGRAVRVSVHGERHTGSPTASRGGRSRGATPRSGDRGVHPNVEPGRLKAYVTGRRL